MLETVDLDGLRIHLEPLLLVDEEIVHGLALITLKLDDIAHLGVGHDGAIASELFLDSGQDLLAGKLLWDALHRSQGFASIALLNADVDVLRLRISFITSVLVGFGEGVNSPEIFDGHKPCFLGVSFGWGVVSRGLGIATDGCCVSLWRCRSDGFEVGCVRLGRRWLLGWKTKTVC